jgi:hypothetical protein
MRRTTPARARVLPSLVDEAVTRHGFTLHASLTIAAEDDLGQASASHRAVMIPHVLPLNSASDRMVAGAKNARREAA